MVSKGLHRIFGPWRRVTVTEKGARSEATDFAKLIGRVPLKTLVREAGDVIEKLCIEAALQQTEDNKASADALTIQATALAEEKITYLNRAPTSNQSSPHAHLLVYLSEDTLNAWREVMGIVTAVDACREKLLFPRKK